MGTERIGLSPNVNGKASQLNTYDGLIYFNPEAGAHLEVAVELIKYDPTYIDIISEEKIRKGYTDFVVSLLTEITTESEIKTKVKSFLNELTASVSRYRILMPVEHLKLIDLDEIKIGNVRLIPFSSIKAEKWKHPCLLDRKGKIRYGPKFLSVLNRTKPNRKASVKSSE
jgi:hypothetical protein